MTENTMSGCTGSCHSCGSSCDTQTGERKQAFSINWNLFPNNFDNVGEENVLQMLNDIVAELEKRINLFYLCSIGIHFR